eukprot:scaffold34_cov62-Phaeocystis_antarctica.AAC.5
MQPASLGSQRGDGDRPSSLRAGDEPEVDAVRHAGEGGGGGRVVPRVHGVPVRRHAVADQVAPQRRQSILVPLAGVEVRGVGVHEVGQGEVADARVQVDHRLALAPQARHARLLRAVTRAKHRAAHVQAVHDTVAAVLGPAVGALWPEQPRAALALQHVGSSALQL